MEILRGIDGPAASRPCVVTIGKFTVVHLGHRTLLDRVAKEAARLDAASAVVTFDRHPAETLAPERVPCLLATLDQRLAQFEEVGVEVVQLLEFTRELAHLEPEAFVEATIVRALGSRKVIVGEDFRFGHNRRGDIALLSKLGHEHGFGVEALPLVDHEGSEVSSTAIRELVAEGAVEDAAALMGRNFRLSGTVVGGDERGRELGFPTANLETDPRACLPGRGVYAGWWVWGGRRLPGAVNVGVRPTFGEGMATRVEIYVLNFDGDLYGERGEIEFHSRLRDELRFASASQLIDQMTRDVAEARSRLT